MSKETGGPHGSAVPTFALASHSWTRGANSHIREAAWAFAGSPMAWRIYLSSQCADQTQNKESGRERADQTDSTPCSKTPKRAHAPIAPDAD